MSELTLPELLRPRAKPLVIDYKTERSNVAELRLRDHLVSYTRYNHCLYSAKAELDAWLNKTSFGNHCKMWVLYETELTDDVLTVYHLTAIGERDRVVCEIKV